MPLRIQYLDDEDELCSLFEAFFATPDVHVTTFTQPEALVRAFGERPPDLLFLDHRLPGTTGEAIARRLAPVCPVVLITGEISIETDFPFARIFHKPYDEAEISALIAAAHPDRVG